MKMSFTFKIAVGFLILLLVLLMMYFINIYFQNEYNQFEKDNKIFQTNTSVFNEMFQVQSIYFIEFTSTEHSRLNIILNKIRENYPKMVLETEMYVKNENIKTYVDWIVNRLDSFLNDYQNYLNTIQTFGFVRMTFPDKNLTNEEIILRKRLISETQNYITRAEDIINYMRPIYMILEKEKTKIEKTRFLFTGLITYIGIFISLSLSILILFRVRRSILKLTDYVGKIAAGDFTAKVDIKTEDELQLLSENIKNIISFEDTLIKIKDSTRTLEESYMRMNEAVSNINTAIKEQEDNVVQASKSFEKLTSSLDEITKNSFETKDITLDTQEKTQISSKQIRDTIAEINLLSEYANKIKGAVKIINSITEQTELLSLNAAIEAAKAGSSGKGFAVVASEIGKLAETSNKATEEIALLAGEIIDKIKRTTSRSEVSIDALHIIETSIEKVAVEIEEISKITQQKSEGTKRLIKEVNRVNEITKRNIEDANKIVDSNMQLKSRVDELHGLVDKFRFTEKV